MKKEFKTHYTRDLNFMLRIRISKTLLAQLKQLASKKNQDMSELVRNTIESQYSKEFTNIN